MPTVPTIKLVDLATPDEVDRTNGEPWVPDANIGTQIAGKYLVESVLGRGGMGLVLAARHMQLGNRVAIKVLHYRGDTGAARFLREAQTCARLTSDHIARVFDFGRLPGGAPYIVMEYLVGRDLATVLAGGPVPVADAVSYVVDACTAVAEAHAAGIVHRDLKPANLFLTTRPRGGPLVKVLDFGISKVVMEQEPASSPDGASAADDRERTAHLTDTGVVIGSPLYVAPEQIRASYSVDTRADIWSLGVILYELLAGHPPFKASTLAELSVAIENEVPAPLSQSRSDLPPGLEAVVAQCLQKDPAARIQSAEALSAALSPFASPEPAAPLDGESRRTLATDPPVAPVSAVESRTRPWVTLLAFAALGLAAIAGVAFGVSSRITRRAETPAASKPSVVAPTFNSTAAPRSAPVQPPKKPSSTAMSEKPRTHRRIAGRQIDSHPVRLDAPSPTSPAPAAAGPLDTPD